MCPPTVLYSSIGCDQVELVDNILICYNFFRHPFTGTKQLSVSGILDLPDTGILHGRIDHFQINHSLKVHRFKGSQV